MKIITRQELANRAAERFRMAHYGPDWHGEALWQPGRTKAQIGVALESLGQNPNPDDVDRIIGNASWTHELCSCCATHRLEKWVVVDVTGGEYSTCICEQCAKKMAELFDARP